MTRTITTDRGEMSRGFGCGFKKGRFVAAAHRDWSDHHRQRCDHKAVTKYELRSGVKSEAVLRSCSGLNEIRQFRSDYMIIPSICL
jgi:hypothetical protein